MSIYIFTELVQLGGRADLQTIFTPSSFLPRAVTSKVKVHVLGRSVNLFEVRLQVSVSRLAACFAVNA